jgi:hypothetical protein
LKLRVTIRLNIDRICAGGEGNGMVGVSVRGKGGGRCEKVGVLVKEILYRWGKICGFGSGGGIEDVNLVIGINGLGRD